MVSDTTSLIQALALLVCITISTARSLPVSECVPALSLTLSLARARGRASLLSTKSDVPRPIWMAGFGDYPHEVCRRGMEVSHPLIVDHATSSAYVPPSVRAILAAGVAAAAGRGAHFLPISCGGV